MTFFGLGLRSLGDSKELDTAGRSCDGSKSPLGLGQIRVGMRSVTPGPPPLDSWRGFGCLLCFGAVFVSIILLFVSSVSGLSVSCLFSLSNSCP